MRPQVGHRCVCDCGVQIITDGRVVGGEDVGGYKIPWFALLHPPGDKTTSICSGCLIDTNHVVTAAHCFTLVSGDKNTAKFGVTLGIYDRCANESSQQTFVVKNVTLHPKFTSPTGNYDIAIITLDEPATNFTPICLPGKAERNVTHRVGEILGFGEMAEDNSTTMPCKLQKAYLQIFGKEQCGRFDLPSHVTNPRVLCAGVVGGGVDSCQGDSGGPLQLMDDGAFVLAGIVSYGFGCGKSGYPGLYTNVFYFRDWIKENT
ncbi:trypsin-1-like isoform X2 [Periplaneta americana]|uniref:trypsin-1-like isoform X2 n=1 Tax=Periplaneta americana TaxID=6978 RepID=UPI0037E9AF4D